MTEQEFDAKLDAFFKKKSVIKFRDTMWKAYAMYLNVRHPSIKHGYGCHPLLGPMLIKVPRNPRNKK